MQLATAVGRPAPTHSQDTSPGGAEIHTDLSKGGGTCLLTLLCRPAALAVLAVGLLLASLPPQACRAQGRRAA